MTDEDNSNEFKCPIDGALLSENRGDSVSTVFTLCPECGVEWEWLLDEAEMVVSKDLTEVNPNERRRAHGKGNLQSEAEDQSH